MDFKECNEFIGLTEYRWFLKESEKLNIIYIIIVELTFFLLLLISNFTITVLFDLMVAYLALVIYLFFRTKLNNLRNLNSRLSQNISNQRFDKDYIFSVPATRNFFGDELPGTLYFNGDKVTFIANRVIGLQLVWFNLQKVSKGFYDLNFLPNSFKTNIKFKQLNIPSKLIFKNSSPRIRVIEKRLYITKIYTFTIPVNRDLINAINSLNYIK